jgi:hypothetical protein
VPLLPSGRTRLPRTAVDGAPEGRRAPVQETSVGRIPVLGSAWPGWRTLFLSGATSEFNCRHRHPPPKEESKCRSACHWVDDWPVGLPLARPILSYARNQSPEH